MKVLSVMVVILLFGTATLLPADEQKTAKPTMQVCTLKIFGMTCAGCEVAVKIAARSIDGVTDVKASYAKKNAEVTYDPSKTNPNAIAKVITEKSGFKAEPVPNAAKK